MFGVIPVSHPRSVTLFSVITELDYNPTPFRLSIEMRQTGQQPNFGWQIMRLAKQKLQSWKVENTNEPNTQSTLVERCGRRTPKLGGLTGTWGPV